MALNKSYQRKANSFYQT